MKIVVAALADCANVSELGKLNIMGIFHAIYVSGVPARHLLFYLAAIMRFQADEKGVPHTIRVAILDADMKEVYISPEGQVTAPDTPADVLTDVNVVVALEGIIFPKFGDYELELVVDQQTSHSISLTVAPIFITPHG